MCFVHAHVSAKMGACSSLPVVARPPVRPKLPLPPPTVTLGDVELNLHPSGKWIIQSSYVENQKKYHTKLNLTIDELEKELGTAYKKLRKKEKKISITSHRAEQSVAKLEKLVQELQFKNKVLLALCTIKEGDVQNLLDARLDASINSQHQL